MITPSFVKDFEVTPTDAWVYENNVYPVETSRRQNRTGIRLGSTSNVPFYNHIFQDFEGFSLLLNCTEPALNPGFGIIAFSGAIFSIKTDEGDLVVKLPGLSGRNVITQIKNGTTTHKESNDTSIPNNKSLSLLLICTKSDVSLFSSQSPEPLLTYNTDLFRNSTNVTIHLGSTDTQDEESQDYLFHQALFYDYPFSVVQARNFQISPGTNVRNFQDRKKQKLQRIFEKDVVTATSRFSLSFRSPEHYSLACEQGFHFSFNHLFVRSSSVVQEKKTLKFEFRSPILKSRTNVQKTSHPLYETFQDFALENLQADDENDNLWIEHKHAATLEELRVNLKKIQSKRT